MSEMEETKVRGVDEPSRVSKPVMFAASLVGVALIGFVDYLTGYEVSLSVFYTAPVIVAVWCCGLWPSVLIAMLSVVTWRIADAAAGHVYTVPIIPLWNSFVRFTFLLLTAYGASAAKFQIQQGKARLKALEGRLPICTCCKRICDAEGYWAEIEVYLSEHSSAEPKSKLCPDCARRLHIQQISPVMPAGGPSNRRTV